MPNPIDLASFVIDHDGVEAILKSPSVAGAVNNLASAVADDVRAARPDADVVVDNYTTDRAASSVTIRDHRGRIWQARDGILTRAAARQGLEVTDQ